MAKWKLFGRSKSKDEENIKPDEPVEEPNEEPINETEEINDTEQEIEKEPLAEHHETLETGVSTSKKSIIAQPSDQRIWRDVNTIESEIDNLHITRAQKPITEVDKAIDKLISKRKRK
jgi:hypothetical protein